MAYLSRQDFESHIYADIISEIIRDNESLIDQAVNAAISLAKSYLRKYDLEKLFSEQVVDENLKDKVKDLACWKLARLANPNINLELFKTLHDDAVAWFRDIMKGNADPDGWPYKEDDPATPYVENSSVAWNSNRKRTQHF